MITSDGRELNETRPVTAVTIAPRTSHGMRPDGYTVPFCPTVVPLERG